jgi:hypothetical protein
METTTANPDPSAVAATKPQPSPKRPSFKASQKVLTEPKPSIPPRMDAPFSPPTPTPGNQRQAEPNERPIEPGKGMRPVILINDPPKAADQEGWLGLSIRIGRAAYRKRGRLAGLVIISLLLLGGGTYLAWGLALPAVVDWANMASWHWSLGWIAVCVLAGGPICILMCCGAAIFAALGFFEAPTGTRELEELDEVEGQIRGSADPIDYARYGRKALHAYYHMGQNQVRVSFYIAIAAMTFGFAFLLAGLVVQALDTTKLMYLRADPDIKLVAVAGGLIIECVAAIFLWIYRTVIVQQAVYYRRQMLVHSALISVPIAAKMQEESSAAFRRIVDAMISPDGDDGVPRLLKVRGATGGKGSIAPKRGSGAHRTINVAVGRDGGRDGNGRQG